MERAEHWRMLLEKLGCIHATTINPPAGKRLILHFGQLGGEHLEVAPMMEHPLHFDDIYIEAHGIYSIGDTTYVLWEDLTSVSLR